MSRGGRGGRGGGRGGRRGPDLSWDDEEAASTPPTNRPGPLFPVLKLKTPKPLTSSELSSVKRYLRLRDRIRNGPLYSVLDPSSLTDDKGKIDKRAGFDPFNDQERYSTKYHKKRRTAPDLTGREYALKYFPQELWSTMDPKRRHPLWQTIAVEPVVAPRKRKRELVSAEEDEDANKEQPSDSDSDAVVTGRRATKAAKTRRDDPTTKQAKQKRGLDAEDDYPDVDQNQDEEGEEADAPQDSEYEESEDGGGDDYNAEQYFDGGDDEEDDGGGGDDEPSY